MRVCAERGFAHAPQQRAETDVARQFVRSASVLAKKPMSGSISRRLRFATGVPTMMSDLRCVAEQQQFEGSEQENEKGRSFATA